MGQWSSRVNEATVPEPTIMLLLGQGPADLLQARLAVPLARGDPLSLEEAPGDMSLIGLFAGRREGRREAAPASYKEDRVPAATRRSEYAHSPHISQPWQI